MSAAPGTRREVFAWSLYDWAASAQSTLVITFGLSYLQSVVMPGKQGATVYAFSVGLSMLAAAALSPIVGALADANRSKRRWLAGTAFVGSAAAVLMAVLPVDWPWAIVAAFVAVNVAFDLSYVPYNGFLAEISDERTVNRVSAYGFALGYLGGSLPLLAATLLAAWGQRSGTLDDVAQHRAGLWMMGLWWGLFSIPVVLVLRDRGAAPGARRPFFAAARTAVAELGQTLRHIRRYRLLAWFLLGFMLYNDGMLTVITQANTLAKQVLNFGLLEMSWLILVIQWVALPSSLAIGWLSDRIGQKATILSCLGVWIAASIAVILVRSSTEFWILGIAVAVVLGGTQSVSRAAMGTMTPPRRAAEFFGFFNVSGRATGFLGPLLFGTINAASENARMAAGALVLFFVIGGGIVAAIDFRAARRAALDEE